MHPGLELSDGLDCCIVWFTILEKNTNLNKIIKLNSPVAMFNILQPYKNEILDNCETRGLLV